MVSPTTCSILTLLLRLTPTAGREESVVGILDLQIDQDIADQNWVIQAVVASDENDNSLLPSLSHSADVGLVKHSEMPRIPDARVSAPVARSSSSDSFELVNDSACQDAIHHLHSSTTLSNMDQIMENNSPTPFAIKTAIESVDDLPLIIRPPRDALSASSFTPNKRSFSIPSSSSEPYYVFVPDEKRRRKITAADDSEYDAREMRALSSSSGSDHKPRLCVSLGLLLHLTWLKKRISRLGACQNCRVLKLKCTTTRGRSVCRRCSASGQECVIPTRKPRSATA